MAIINTAPGASGHCDADSPVRDSVRRYQRIDGFWFPCRDETFVDVKLYGRRVFTVDHQQYVIDPGNRLQAEKGDMNDPISKKTSAQGW